MRSFGGCAVVVAWVGFSFSVAGEVYLAGKISYVRGSKECLSVFPLM